MLEFIRTHKLAVGAGAIVAVAGLAWLAFGFFGVHTLFVDDVVDEAGPVFDAAPADPNAAVGQAPVPTTVAPAVTAPPATTDSSTGDTTPPAEGSGDVTEAAPTTVPTAEAPATTAPAAPEITTEFVGTFVSDAHPTAGTASVLGNGTGQRFLRFENFETDNGPDLNVYLVNSSTGDVSDYINLGDLKGNIGDQNYEIPAGVDLSVYDQVVIWCVRFSVGFGDAQLMAT